MSTDRFYADLPAIADFAGVADLAAYSSAPDDWTVLHTDVVDSTGAIAAGRYKDVNLMGAAGITAVLNAAPGHDIPYVFGGDGASLLVPQTVLVSARDALVSLAGLAQSRFGLSLRVGEVALTAIRDRGADISIRKLSLSPGNTLALFGGGGLELADRLVKDPTTDNPFRLAIPSARPPPDLEGLSCRWEPLRAAHGVSLTLMLRAAHPDSASQSALLKESLAAIQAILMDDGSVTAPVRRETLRFRFPPRTLWSEAKATSRLRSPWLRLVKVAAVSAIFALAKVLKAKVGPVHLPTYLKELQTDTDFRKYDGFLRLVLDVSPEQADAIEAYLDGAYRGGRLIYGVHRADAALMTCLVFSLEAGQHIHFIDGADGGFTLAAKAMKARMAKGIGGDG
jgi:hypothetical protein